MPRVKSPLSDPLKVGTGWKYKINYYNFILSLWTMYVVAKLHKADCSTLWLIFTHVMYNLCTIFTSSLYEFLECHRVDVILAWIKHHYETSDSLDYMISCSEQTTLVTVKNTMFDNI